MTILTVILAILGFGFLVVAHEFGHFTAARLCGVAVNEFWVGMGPAILHRRIGETEFKLCIFPFGGACVMEGEDEDTGKPGCFTSASWWKRAIILAAGAFMNFVAGFLIIFILLFPQQQMIIPQLSGLEVGCPGAGEDGLQPGDTLLRIDGYRILTTSDVSLAFQQGDDDYYDFVVKRDGKKQKLTGVYLPLQVYNNEQTPRRGVNFAMVPRTGLRKLTDTAARGVNFARMVWMSLGQLITGKVGVNQLSGPVGVTDVLANTARSSLSSFFMLVAFISINLGVMNLLPLPALDGGRLLFVLIEAVIRRPVSRRYEALVHTAGFALLMLLMVYVTWQDIVRLIAG